MNDDDIDQRWKTTAAAARPVWHDAAGELPFGFATRTLARWRETPRESWEDILILFGRRTMIAALALCFASAGFAYVNWYDAPIEPPALELVVSLDFPQP